jgi:heavy metal sensor kinase
MSLVTRLTAFFLTALVLVLAGFSVALYYLADAYLRRQLDDRLEAGLNALEAVVEIKPGLVEWEGEEHSLSLGREAGADQVRWLVRDGAGRVKYQSANFDPAEGFANSWPEKTDDQAAAVEVRHEGQRWRLRQRRLLPAPMESSGPARSLLATESTEFLLTAGLSLEPMRATLHTLAATLGGVALGLWLTAAVVSRRLCRRALAPVARMAAAARSMSETDRDQRLPSPATRDELAELGRAFNGLLDRLQESFERQRRFTGDAAHQLRTPLTAVLGQIEVALNHERNAAEYKQVLARAHGQAAQMSQLVEMLLYLARADADARVPDLETLDLSAWLTEHLRRWDTHPRAADLRQERAVDEPLWVRAHAPLLGQLVDNLLDNACKYSEPGTPIRLRVGRESGTVFCMVEDAGCGIDPADLPHVFEPFYRADHARRLGRPGVGLGLAVAARIAATFGGTLDARSEPGRGSCFRLSLPEVIHSAKVSLPEWP